MPAILCSTMDVLVPRFPLIGKQARSGNMHLPKPWHQQSCSQEQPCRATGSRSPGGSQQSHLASEPSPDRWQWFVQKDNAEALPWFQKFAYNPVYVPNAHQGMPLTHSALLSLLWSLQQRNGWKIRASGLATMLFPNLKRESRKREVNRGIENLRKKGLLDECGKVTIEEKHHHLWRDADHLANPRSRSDVGYASLRELVVDALADASYQCKIFKDLQGLGKRLEEYEHFMKIAGYSQPLILDYWHEVVFAPGYCYCQCRPLEAFVAKGFMPVFNIAEERTSRNRISGSYTGISLGFLRKMTQYELLTIKDMDARTNSNGESLLRYYEPNEERMRANVKMAGNFHGIFKSAIWRICQERGMHPDHPDEQSGPQEQP